VQGDPSILVVGTFKHPEDLLSVDYCATVVGVACVSYLLHYGCDADGTALVLYNSAVSKETGRVTCVIFFLLVTVCA
jgi:hypothetical protein